VIATETINTIADGLAVRIPIEEALDDMRFVVDDILLVDDQMILEAMRMLFRELGLVIEPAGAPGVAAAISYRERFAEKLIATILCGANMTEEQVRRWLFDGL